MVRPRPENITLRRHHIRAHHRGADVVFVVLARTHAAIGQHDAGAAIGREMVEHVLQPGIVGVALRRVALHPAQMAFEAVCHQSLVLKGELARLKSARSLSAAAQKVFLMSSIIREGVRLGAAAQGWRS